MRDLWRLVVAIGFLGLTAGAAFSDPPQKPSLDDDRKALQGIWEFDGPKVYAYSFRFDGTAVSFSSSGVPPVAIRPGLPRAEKVAFTLVEDDGQRYLELAKESAPAGIDRRIRYRLDGDRLVLTVRHGDQPHEYNLRRIKQP